MCLFFYKIGRKSILDEHKKKQWGQHKRKKVDSTVVDKEDE